MTNETKSNDNAHLQRSLTSRHITMLALGGAIGAGLFKGSANAVHTAGPSVILCYLLGGLILLFIMQGMAEMAANNPSATGFSGLLQPILGPFAAYLVDWAYFTMWFVDLTAEAVAAASFIQIWFPTVPTWLIVLVIAVVISGINLLSVRWFAETEYWLAIMKIAVIIFFIFAGIFLIARNMMTTNHAFVNLTVHGGFFPHGAFGFLSAMLIVIYSFAGSELIGITLGEVKDPQKVIPHAVHGIMFRIISFYLIPFFIIVTLFPWDQLTDKVSPFVSVFRLLNIPFASDIVNFVIILALISSINSGIYSASRLLFVQNQRNKRQTKVTTALTRLNKHFVPYMAVLMCSLSLFAGVLLTYFIGNTLFDYLVGSISYTILVIWILLCLGHIRSRRYKFDDTTYHVSLYPWTSYFSLIALVLVFFGILFSTNIIVTVLTIAIYVGICAYYYFTQRESLYEKSKINK
ncbi:amino acid permease [Furfurilactobacillus milii]|uniref:Amino acid permease n=1 Tax=Furfurilactobacillus rossiae TaxID=231049 RepID=A0A7C9MLW9_9LACO|nr:amino acid permease [Furfurilactobacillus milii]MYV05245.1 amino acid permease [Furfurilactobacillus milii]